MANTRPLFIVAAFAVIFNEEGQVLLCHRRDMDAWNLPGGGVEPGELPDESAVREVLEETGLEVEVERLIGVYGKPGRNDIIFAFVCRVTGGRLQETDESDENRFFNSDQLPPNTLMKHAERIWDAEAGYPAPIFRRQTNIHIDPPSREAVRRNSTSKPGGSG